MSQSKAEAPSLEVELPDKLIPILFNPARYRVAYGGRGSAKSHSFAAAAMLRAYQKSTRIGCFREIQNSIKDSVHTLISDKIRKHFGHFNGLGGFQIGESYIRHINGSEFLFKGLKGQTAESVKSFEGLDIAWVEEAQTVSADSWDLLIPTIRAEGSEIWVTFNPKFEMDATSQMFIENEHPDALVTKINYDDNPWFPEVLQKEMEHKKLIDPKGHAHVWLGEYKDPTQGGIVCYPWSFANEDENITYNPERKVYLSCDFNLDPMFWVIGHISLIGNKRHYEIFDEIARGPTNIRECAELFCEKYGKHKAGIIITGDANSGRARSDASDVADRKRWDMLEQVLSDNGVKNFARDVNPSNPRIQARIEVFNNLVCDSDGLRRVKVNPKNCPRLIYCFKNMRYIPGSDQVFIPTSKMIEKDPEMRWLRDDGFDAVSYLTWKFDPIIKDGSNQPRNKIIASGFTPG